MNIAIKSTGSFEPAFLQRYVFSQNKARLRLFLLCYEQSLAGPLLTNPDDNFAPAVGAGSFIGGFGLVFIDTSIHSTASEIDAQELFRFLCLFLLAIHTK